MKTIYEAYHLDADEQRAKIHIGYFATAEAARDCIEDYRTKFTHPVPPHHVGKVDLPETYKEFQEQKRAELVASARRKLTDAERAAIGI